MLHLATLFASIGYVLGLAGLLGLLWLIYTVRCAGDEFDDDQEADQ